MNPYCCWGAPTEFATYNIQNTEDSSIIQEKMSGLRDVSLVSLSQGRATEHNLAFCCVAQKKQKTWLNGVLTLFGLCYMSYIISGKKTLRSQVCE